MFTMNWYMYWQIVNYAFKCIVADTFLRSGEGRIVVIIADETFNINIIYNYTFV